MPGSCPVKQLTETQSRQKGAREKKTIMNAADSELCAQYRPLPLYHCSDSKSNSANSIGVQTVQWDWQHAVFRNETPVTQHVCVEKNHRRSIFSSYFSQFDHFLPIPAHIGFKCWRPILDGYGHATSYQQHIREMIAKKNDCFLIDFDRERPGKYFGNSWYETWHLKTPNDCFCFIRTLAAFACFTQASSGTAFTENFEFAAPTNSSARIETVEIKSVKKKKPS